MTSCLFEGGHKTLQKRIIPLLGIYSRESITYVHVNYLYTHVHSSTVHNHPKVETIQTSINRRMD